MLKRLRFAFSYALRNMRRDRQRTAFALFSIAVGVATVVALRMLGLMLTDALTDNVRALLRGDIRVATSSFGLRISALSGNEDPLPITSKNIAEINKWAANHDAEITYAITNELMQTSVIHDGKAGSPAFIMSHFVDPKVYPFYDTIRADQPSGVLLANLFDGPRQIVVARRLADQLDIKVGDQMHIGSATDLFTVKGIVPDTSETNFTNPLSLLFSFVYLDRHDAGQFNLDPQSANSIFLKLKPGTDAKPLVYSIATTWPFSGRGGFNIDTADDVLVRNKFAADFVSRFVLLLSLVALVIGGVGIINTMLVAVNRRSAEIAVLKTLGLQGRGVLIIFLAEAVVMGFFGSLIGLGIGLLLSLLARSFGEQAFQIALPWRFSFEPLLLGMVLGMITTAIFSVLPTLMASQVRPGLVLRQGTVLLARTGCLPLLISVIIFIIGIGGMVDGIIGGLVRTSRKGGFVGPVIPIQLPVSPGILTAIVTFIFLAIAVGIMWILVWLLGKLPSLRNPNFRLAIRGLNLHRPRTALSLLALIVGMTALSGTLIMSRSINLLLQTSVSGPLGGNVVVLPLPIPIIDPAALARTKLDTAPGVSGYRDLRFTQVRLLAINGDRNYDQHLSTESVAQTNFLKSQLNFMIGVRIHGNPPRGTLLSGRYLTEADTGQYRIVIPYKAELDALDVKVGSTFTYQIGFGTEQHDFEVVGIVAPDPQSGLIPISLGDGAIQTPLDTIQRTSAPDLIIANVKPESVKDAMAVVGTAPGSFVFDVGLFDSFFNRLFSQLAALPLLVAVLSLFAAGVLIATTVSLATMERRRQIGILKTLGVTRRQALNQLLIENGIVGAVGGIISLMPTLLIIQGIPLLTENLVHLPLPVDLVLLMFALSVLITLGATLLTAWSASGEKPLTVLRYE